MDIKRINAAVRVKIAYDRLCGTGKPSKKRDQLAKDLRRLTDSLTMTEYNQYIARIK